MSTIYQRDMTPKEVASELGCHVKYVLAEIKRKRIAPVFKVNARVIRVPRSTFESYRQRLAA